MLQAFSTAFAETTYAAPLESHDAPMLHTRPTSFTWVRPIRKTSTEPDVPPTSSHVRPAPRSWKILVPGRWRWPGSLTEPFRRRREPSVSS